MNLRTVIILIDEIISTMTSTADDGFAKIRVYHTDEG
jgi:hypothetical protein